MASHVLPDPSSQFGERVRRRLQDERIAWLTTVGDDGTPQPNPIWFLWDGETVLVYNRADAQRLRHIRSRPRVSLNFNNDADGGDIVVLVGRAELAEGEPLCHEVAEYVTKYGESMVAIGGSLEGFARAYPVPLRVHPVKVRGF
ncbi:MAG TPA: TIGR03667 family PPOX class F420-dependent oxidoreductase [Candidatus Dormibacteraeota bacterium]|nr:TIGR03667 family PPOX class F420-dependent oxidoreductase [Candidatus Dormibacteraeota bacterium]